MKYPLKSIGEELAARIAERFASPEVRALLEETKAAPDSDTGTFEVVITTENLDRYQEVIKLDGWDLTHYLANPVVLWGHDHNRLIGIATSVEIADGKMVAKGKFAPTEEGQEKRRLYDLGFLKATSVGFIEKEREGNLITKAELLEFSFVSVPANPYALSLAMEKELNVNDLVTKGIMFVEKDAEEAPESPETAPEGEHEPEDIPDAETQSEELEEPQERSLSTKQIASVIDGLKSAIVALEALGTKAGEPEGDEEPTGDEGETEDERAYRDFSEKRRVLQHASTILGDVLAEARQVKDARKAA
ncbi:HK97 family phage prohead protease [Parerythrobacter lacustris]|uniref:HK97 family phage prohead protease n=1 Tax=Parerythrobacter lacustris TaxID=2969984 RepID=A0ABT1XP86_9SPHN|nr:HK97 family phage prohead protease [Parerythrobacter lacustris]MCR2833485.1 HK97 family phage prohead protease [Parerythrobacter lacustris]